MITIVISTSNRLTHLQNTINDLVQLSHIIDKIIIFSYNDHFSSKIIKQKFSKKFKNLIIIYSKNKFVLEDRIREISTNYKNLVKKSKYIWFFGDKDRLLSKKLLVLKNYLSKNICGLSINVRSLDKNKPRLLSNNLNANLFQIERGIHKLGLISSHIINTRLFIKYSYRTFKSAYYLSEIVTKIISREKNWLFISQKIIGYNHMMKNINTKYLDYRIQEEFRFYINKINMIFSEKNENIRNKIIIKAFLKNILSWIVLLKLTDEKNFQIKMKKITIYFKNYLIIKIIIFFITYCPNSILSYIKKLKKTF